MHNIIYTKSAPKPIGPYSQGIKRNNIVMTSGQIAINKNNQIISDNIVEQARVILQNIKNIIQKSGLQINDIIKMTIFVTQLNEMNEINVIYNDFFQTHNARLPARTCVEVSNLPKNAKIEIDAIAIQH
ncbi:2-iminobutanoate/2-iminopropanoate deaminase [Buchnera aphidicola (Takecallis arundicolens)]|uniref:Rid family detoxifying hydrolase n=1 Tax=Buchnera aphidicola TaxID=9 RepID=UPI00346388DC